MNIFFYNFKVYCLIKLFQVAINPSYQESEIQYALNKVKVKALICPPNFKKQNYCEILKRFVNIENGERGKLKSEKVPSLQNVIMISDNTLRGTYLYEELLNSPTESELKKIRKEHSLIQSDDGFNIQFTSVICYYGYTLL